MAYSVEKDLEQMDKRKKRVAKSGRKRQDKIAEKEKAKEKENWAQKLKRSVQMILQGENYKVPKKKK